METKVHYYLDNNGDGSASLILCESEELADIEEKYMDEPLRDCTGSIVIESDSPVKVHGIRTVDEATEEAEEEIQYGNDDAKKKLEALKELKEKGEEKQAEPNGFYFQIDEEDHFMVVSKEYFDKFGSLDDSEDCLSILEALPQDFFEVMDSTYGYQGNLEDGRRLLLKYGFEEKVLFDGNDED